MHDCLGNKIIDKAEELRLHPTARYQVKNGCKMCTITNQECLKRIPCTGCTPSKDETKVMEELYRAVMLRVDIHYCKRCQYYSEYQEPRDCHTTHSCNLFTCTLGFDREYERCGLCVQIFGK